MAENLSDINGSIPSKKKVRPTPPAYTADVVVSTVHSKKPRNNRVNRVSLVTKRATPIPASTPAPAPVKRKRISAHVRELRAHAKELRAHARERRAHTLELRERAREARKREREAQERAVGANAIELNARAKEAHEREGDAQERAKGANAIELRERAREARKRKREAQEHAQEIANIEPLKETVPAERPAGILGSGIRTDLLIVLILLALGVTLLAIFFGSGGFVNFMAVANATTSKTTSITIAPTSTIGATPVNKVIVIVLENKGYNNVIGTGAAPYQTLLASHYALASNYLAVARPSLPNYLAMISGSSLGVNSDCLPSQCVLTATTITDLLEAKGMSWKGYEESMPENCSQTNSTDGLYSPIHNPFVYFVNITSTVGSGNVSAYCSSHDVPFDQFWVDLEANNLPSYSFITPNLCNDGHDCLISVSDQWLSTVVPRIINSSSFSSTALFIVYDEGNSNSPSNRVALTLVSPFAKEGYTSKLTYTHYSFLATVESLLGLGSMGRNDLTANVMSDLFAMNQTAVQLSGS